LVDSQRSIAREVDFPAAFVDAVMVFAAHGQQVRKIGEPAAFPPVHMMGVMLHNKINAATEADRQSA